MNRCRRERFGGATKSDSRPAIAARAHHRSTAHPGLLRSPARIPRQAVSGGTGDAGFTCERSSDRDRPADRRHGRQRGIELKNSFMIFFSTCSMNFSLFRLFFFFFFHKETLMDCNKSEN